MAGKQPTRSLAYLKAENGYDGAPAADYVGEAIGFAPGWGSSAHNEWPQLDIGAAGVTIKHESGAHTLIPWHRVIDVQTGGPRP